MTPKPMTEMSGDELIEEFRARPIDFSGKIRAELLRRLALSESAIQMGKALAFNTERAEKAEALAAQQNLEIFTLNADLCGRIAQVELVRAERDEAREHIKGFERERDRLEIALETARTARTALTALTDAMNTCHHCGATLLPDERTPPHCEDCPSGCEHHEAPDCRSMGEFIEAIRAALESTTPDTPKT